MSDSKQKVIGRNRTPRVQIEYDVEHYGASSTIELPFVMGVMADLSGDSETDEAQKPVADRAFATTDAEDFNKYMGALAPRVKARVKNTLPSKDGGDADEEMFVDVTFKTMSDFAPDKIAEQVPALAELLRMRNQLEELLSYMDGKVDAEKRIAQLLNNEPLLAQAAEAAIEDQSGEDA
ncbi:MAG: type VI secretion system contractile sheath small subunit [Pseudomonadota bacterium]